MTRKFFIVSTGLTGTHFLGNSLNELEDVVSYHELSPIMGKEGSRYIRWRNNTFRNTTVRNYFPFNLYYRWKFKFSRLPKIPNDETKTFVEANSSLSFILPEVKNAFPESKIIQIVRDPREFIQSALNRGWYLDNDLFPNQNPYYTGEYTREEWFQTTPFARASWIWINQNKMMQNNNPDLVLNFDDIFRENHEGFKTLVEFIGHDLATIDLKEFFSDKDRPTKFDLVPDYQDWKDEWQEQTRDAISHYKEKYLN